MNIDPPCAKPIPAASTDEQVMRESIAVMERHNIIGMVSGEPEAMRTWRAAAPKRIISGIDFRLPGTPCCRHVRQSRLPSFALSTPVVSLRYLVKSWRSMRGFAATIRGSSLIGRLPRSSDIPVAIHWDRVSRATPMQTAAIGPRSAIRCCSRRCWFAIRGCASTSCTPDTRWSDSLRALMFSHPQVYVDIGSIVLHRAARPPFTVFCARSSRRVWRSGHVRVRPDDLAGGDRADHQVIEEAPTSSPPRRSATSSTIMPRDSSA